MGRSFKSPLSGTLLIAWHFGHLIVSRPWLVVCQCFKQCRQNVCRHGRCFGSVYTLVHTGHETSSRRLWSNVLTSIYFSLRTEHTLEHVSFSRNWTRNNDALWHFLAILGTNYLLWQQVLCINQSENFLKTRNTLIEDSLDSWLSEMWKLTRPMLFGSKMSRKTRRSLEGDNEWTFHKGGFWRVCGSTLLGKFSLSFVDRRFDCATVLNKIYF